MVMPADSINMNSLNDTVLRLSSTSSLNSNALGLSAAICNNHGRCTMRSDGDFKCLCDAGYTGRYCQESEHHFYLCNYAFHSGWEQGWIKNFKGVLKRTNRSGSFYSDLARCLEIVFTCWKFLMTVKRFSGINECELQPCMNGATCVDKVNSFLCICPEGWEGETCSKRMYQFKTWHQFYLNYWYLSSLLMRYWDLNLGSNFKARPSNWLGSTSKSAVILL